ncbi:MAG: hypothetical protein KDB08_09795, partial [Microthrixaceae bacterium]|nr:hypothetical protein [Microthrixaceae bacterium]
LAEFDALFDHAMSDEISSWRLEPDGTWVRHARAADGTPLRDLQDLAMTEVVRRRRRRIAR